VKKTELTSNKWRTDLLLLVLWALKKSRSLNKISMKILAT
jgi:hypothetical protein